jgi:8-oxo-dGTP pyrophosphatase MutT (NUDIX family)
MPEPAIPAATVIVMRDVAEGPPELLMVERAAAMAFAGGALVFPGGRVDPEDRALAATMAGDPDEVAHRVAAIRETIEEAGVAIGIDIAADRLAALRQGLHAGEPFGALLDEAGARADPEVLLPFAHWLPSGLGHRVFDTRFYLARAPHDAQPAPDEGESVRAFWTSAREALAMADAGTATLIFPTRRNLERLAQFGSFVDAVADARNHPIKTVTPWIEERDGQAHLCIPPGLGYPVTAEPLHHVRRA